MTKTTSLCAAFGNHKVLHEITDKKQNCWSSSCVEIFPPTSYVKKWIKFRTTTNRIKVPFSANRPSAIHIGLNRKCETINAITYRLFGEGLNRGKRTKFALQIVQKALNARYSSLSKFSKISRGACPRTPLELFLFPYLLQI